MTQISIGGTVFYGRSEGGRLGSSATLAGDINGDGFEDLIFGAPLTSSRNSDGSIQAFLSGEVVIIYGTGSTFAPIFNAEFLGGENGYLLVGDDIAFAEFGADVAGAGDLNADGIDDLLIGAPGLDRSDISGELHGASFFIFGQSDPVPGETEVTSLPPTTLKREEGQNTGDLMGFAVSGAGDVDGDRIDDALVTIPGYTSDGAPNAGAIAVIYGSPNGPSAVSDLNGNNGFLITGAETLDNAGAAVARAGDINGDGLQDILIGAIGADGAGIDAGEAFVVYGSALPRPATLDLGSLGTHGVRILGAESASAFGGSLAALGDINNDGIDDFAVGAPRSSTGGTVSLIYGVQGGLPEIFSVANLLVGQGSTFTSSSNSAAFGNAIAGLGDVNGDGIDDFLIGDPLRDTDNGQDSGGAYLIFGRDGNLPAEVDMKTSTLEGYAFHGAASFDNLGASVSPAGDQNSDGFQDFLISADGANRPGAADVGAVYLIYGGPERLAAQDAVDGAADGIIHVASLGAVLSFRESGQATTRGNLTQDTTSGSGPTIPTQIMTGPGNDLIEAGSGDHIILSGAGDDIVIASTGADALRLGTGDDFADGEAGDDLLFGWTGADILFGGPGADRLFGGTDDDYLDGGAGNDLLQGGAGADLFVFEAGFGDDQVLDFDLEQDLIDFSNHENLTSFADLILSSDGNGTLIEDGLGGKIKLLNIALPDINGDHFVFW